MANRTPDCNRMAKQSRVLLVILLPIAASGCASIYHGESQTISVDSVPSGARCALVRHGESLGQISSTPGSLDVESSRDPILVTCDRAGYDRVVGTIAARVNGDIYGNLVFYPTVFWLVGTLIDVSTGAGYTYDPNITVTFSQQVRPGQLPERLPNAAFMTSPSPYSKPF